VSRYSSVSEGLTDWLNEEEIILHPNRINDNEFEFTRIKTLKKFIV